MLFGGNWRFTRKLAFTAPSSSRGWAGIRGGFRNGTGNGWEGLGGRLGADGDFVVRVKREVAASQHAGGEISHDRHPQETQQEIEVEGPPTHLYVKCSDQCVHTFL